jgi:cytochrome c-type biogenesis protein CcmH/NrfG
MDQAADKLARRLEQKDGNADDWALLARSYVELKMYPQAARAFERALAKAPGDGQLKKEAAAAAGKM